MRYTFGHTDIAADRIRSIAGFFNPLAAEFIREYLPGRINSAADLGCGPGYTTDMLADVTGAAFTIGMDISEHFIQLAKRNYPQYNFLVCDLTRWMPVDRYDLLYCRFLLSHLNNRRQLLRSWIDHLYQGGRIFIDELEAIMTEIPVFRRYLDINNSLVKSQGATLFAGGLLNQETEGFNVTLNRSDYIPVKDSMAAAFFYPNTVSIWCEDDFVRRILPAGERNEISDELLNIMNSEDNLSNITWIMKRIIITK